MSFGLGGARPLLTGTACGRLAVDRLACGSRLRAARDVLPDHSPSRAAWDSGPPSQSGPPAGPAQAGAVHGCEPGVQHAGGPAEPAVAGDRRGAIPDDPSRPVGNGRGKGAGY